MNRLNLATGRFALCVALAVALTCAAALLAGPACADAEDPIDQALDTCLASDTGQTNAGMIRCTSTAISAWNGRLNETYQKVMAALDPKSRALLRASERNWVAFRTAEQAAQAGPWHDSRGSDIDLEVLGDDLSAIKERTGELKTYLPPD